MATAPEILFEADDGGTEGENGDIFADDGTLPEDVRPAEDAASCDPVVCGNACRASGAADGHCESSGCVCTGTADAGADGGADADADADGTEAPACPIRGCTTGSESRRGCGNARTIGRTAAAAGFRIDDSTCYESDRIDDDSDCWTAGGDHAYRIFLRAGESVRVRLEVDWPCPSSESGWWDSTLHVYGPSSCDAVACAESSRVYCEEWITSSHETTIAAVRDGWHVIVVDGTTAFDCEGDYSLRVTLTCAVPGCEC